MEMRVIALGQQKGGVGKSAAAINLACQAIAKGETAAIIDMDTDQGTSIEWGKNRNSEAPLVLSCDPPKLPGILGKLRDEKFDWVFLDLPGRSAPAASAGLAASDLVIVPCRPVEVDINASANTVEAALRGKKPYRYLMNISPPQLDKKRARQVMLALEEAGHPVIPVIIVQRTLVPDAIAAGKGANEVDPSGPSASEFSELFAWLKENVK